ncbi:oligosaccharide flippase family protein [Marinifilum sp. N1E240]|uniref:lipopolysaccharide biosynthesis protein n=1 Tax=Marinifilum sp. N1E240 TaxID=2608082 RepID=UPI00128C1949|nr:lipopolysaccharide biosynthesis protein [Marinifilum sp. N1E240]MPQ46453.1 oligosaccharide flippase family protein [Marinifilum sp. N1E240]
MKAKIIFKGIKWASFEFAFSFTFRFLVKLVLAKLILPKDFGLVGMTTIFIGVVFAASELGMGAALIQKKENQDAERLFNTAFWSGLIWGVGLYLLMCFGIGPIAASFYNEPLLLQLIPVLSLGILLKPLNLIHTVILTRSMNFKKLALINNSAALIAGFVGLYTAYIGFGVWALVLNNAIISVLTVPLLFLTTRWIPKLEWIKSYFKEIIGFSVYSTGTSVFSTITYNADNLIIGKLLGASSLGVYTLAFSLTETLRQAISSILNKVMYPVFGQLQKNKSKLKSYFLMIVNINAIMIYPIMFFFVLFGKEMILDIFGTNWGDAVLPLRVLSIAVMIHLIINSFASLLRGLGYPGLEFKIILGITLFILIPGLYFGIIGWGLLGATIAILVNKISLVIVALIFLKKHIKIKLIEIILAVKGAVLSVSISSILIFILKFICPNMNWIVISIFYFLFYLIVILYFEKEMIKLLKVKLLKTK